MDENITIRVTFLTAREVAGDIKLKRWGMLLLRKCFVYQLRKLIFRKYCFGNHHEPRSTMRNRNGQRSAKIKQFVLILVNSHHVFDANLFQQNSPFFRVHWKLCAVPIAVTLCG